MSLNQIYRLQDQETSRNIFHKLVFNTPLLLTDPLLLSNLPLSAQPRAKSKCKRFLTSAESKQGGENEHLCKKCSG